VGWDGPVADIYNYGGTFVDGAGNLINDPGREVDAIANNSDAFFGEVVTNVAHLLVSVQGDPGGKAVWIHRTDGTKHGWATDLQVNPNGSVTDLDGLEVWGPAAPPTSDSSRMSLLGDPGVPGAAGPGVPRTSIWACNLAGGLTAPPCTSWVTAATIAAVIGQPNLEEVIDLDALMTSGDQLLFSIRPAGPFDGGEIWFWDGVAALATFLVHGGITWDTANDVTKLFGAENVDALEATINDAPEPGSLALLGLGLAALARNRRRI
jgi:hypothetical protein